MNSHDLRFADLLTIETVRGIDEQSALDDASAMTLAGAHVGTRERQLLVRARTLAQELRLESEFKQARRLLIVLGVVAAMVVAALTASLIHSIFGTGRNVNALVALLALLVPNLVGIPVWLVALMFRRGSGKGFITQGLLTVAGQLGSARTAHVIAATSNILDRNRLTPWVWGGVNHAVWSLVYVALLVIIWFSFAFREYQIGWETTILSQATFDRLLRAVAALPSLLGLPAHDAQAVSAGPAARSDALAWWLMSAVVAYGLLPRVVALLACAAVWLWRRNRLTLDLAAPYYRKLLNRLDAIAPSHVVDAQPVRANAAPHPASTWQGQRGTLFTLAFELPPEVSVPARLESASNAVLTVDGSIAGRATAVQRLMEQEPEALVILCHASSTPDRGTARFIEDVAPSARHAALLLVPDTQAAHYAARWRNWLDDCDLARIAQFNDEASALSWAGRDHG